MAMGKAERRTFDIPGACFMAPKQARSLCSVWLHLRPQSRTCTLGVH